MEIPTSALVVQPKILWCKNSQQKEKLVKQPKLKTGMVLPSFQGVDSKDVPYPR